MRLPSLRRRAKSSGQAPPAPVLREEDLLPTGLYVLGDMGSRFPTMRHRAATVSAPNSPFNIPRLIVEEPFPPSTQRVLNRERPFFATLSTVIVRNETHPT